MLRLSLNLPKYRLEISLAKRRTSRFPEPILPSLEEIKNVRSGSKISRFFRHIFEHKNIKKLLGTNLALMLIAASFIPSYAEGNNIDFDGPVSIEAVTDLTTRHGVQYPVEKVIVTQGFWLLHPGIDLDGVTGDPIKPIMAGQVEAISFSKYAYGNAVLIDHGNQITSLYGHLSKIEVQPGDNVTTNTEIGKMGSTGHSSGDHLHLEVRDHGRPINPLSILPRP